MNKYEPNIFCIKFENYNKNQTEHKRKKINPQPKRMTSILKQQTYRVIVTIHSINIAVKFPCSVTAGIRADSKDTQFNKDFKLINNQAKIQQTLSTDLKVIYNSKTKIFTQVRINFLVFLKSSNGRIAAGSATVSIKSDRQHHRTKISIEKCPDKTASIEYSLKMTLLKQQDHNQQPNLSRSSLNAVEYSINSPSMNNKELHYSSIRDGSSQRLKTQTFNSRVTNVRNFDDRVEKQKSESGSQIKSQAHSRISKLLMQEQKSEVNSQRQKIIELERQKVRAMKQIRNLKHELQTNSLRNSSVSQSHDQALIMRHESKISLLQEEVEKERGKANEHQTQSHKRKLKIQQLQKELKIIQKKYDQTEQQLKKQISQKQKQSQKNKELNLELKQLRQKYEDQLLMYENFVKRSEFKQNVYKEQLRTLNEKYTISQTEKQKLLFERNQIINEYEQKNKKEKQGYRGRQKLGAQEKSKLIKKTDTLQKQLQSKIEQKEYLEQKLTQLQALNKKHKVTIENLQYQLQETQRIASEAKSQVQKQRRTKQNLQIQLSNIQKMSEQKSSMKKILEQKQNQISQLTKIKNSLEGAKKTMSQKYEQQQSLLKQRNNSIKSLQKELETLKKQNQSIKKSQQQKSKQLLDITFIKKNQESKIFGLNQQLRQVQKRNKAKQNENNKEIQNLKNKLFQLEEENNEISEKNYIINQQLFEYQKHLNDLKASYQIKLTQIDRLEAQLSSSVEKQENLTTQMQELMGIKAQMEEGYEEKMQKFKKKLNEVQNERSQYLNKLQKITRSSQQTITKLNTQLKNNASENKNRDKQMHQLRLIRDENEMQVLSLTTQLQQTTLQLHKKCKQLQSHKEKAQTLKEQYMELQSRLKQYQFQLQTNKNQIRIFEENIAVYRKQKQQLTAEAKRSQKQFEKFKSNNQYFLKTFFNIINQSDIPEVINVTHDDSEIVKSMMQVLKKRKSIKQEYDKNMEQLQNFNDELRKQLSLLDEEIQMKQKIIEKAQKQLNQSKKLHTQSNKGSQKRQREYEKEIEQLRVKIIEGEKHREQLQRGSKQLSSIIGQKQGQIQKLTQQIKGLQRAKAATQQKMQGLRKQNQKQIKQLLENTNHTIDQLKRQLDVVKLQLQTEEKKRTLVSIHNEQFLNELQVCKQDLFDEQNKNKIANQDIRRLKHQIAEMNEALLKKQKYIAQKQSNYNSLLSQLDDKGEEETNMRQRMVNYEITIKGLNQKIERLEVKIMELEEQRSSKKQAQKQLEEQIKKGQNENKKILKQLENEKKTKASLENKVKQMQQKLKEKQQEMKEQRRQIQNLNKKINIISHENTGERQRLLKDQENFNKKNEMKIKQKQKQVENARVEIGQLKANNTKLSSTIQNLEKKVNQYELQNKKHSENSSKKLSTLQKDNQNLNQQLNQSRNHLKTLQSNLNELSRNFQNYQIQNNNQIGYLHPILQKLKKLLADSEQYLKFMNQFEASKNKLIKISNYKLQNYNYNNMGEIAKEINIAAQRCKVQIINKSKIPQEDRTAIVEQFKTLQGAIQKIIRY